MTKLSERAMLVSLHIGSWQGMMHDRTVTEEISEQFKAEKEAGRYNKRLVANKFLRGVETAHRHARGIHKLLTLPWEDDGTRILTAKGYTKYQEKMHVCRLQIETEVRDFINGLPEYITEAQTRLGEMFNIEEYPSADQLKEKFNFDVEVGSLPDAADFRAKLSDDTVKSIVKDIEKRCNLRLENAVNDVFERVIPLLKNMIKRLRDYQPASGTDKAKGVIRDPLVYNIYELAETMPTLNFTEDPRIDKLREQLIAELVDPASPEILRSDTKARQAAITNAEKILKKVEGYLK